MVDGIQISKSLLFQLVEDDEKTRKKTRKTKSRTPEASQKPPPQKPTPNEPEMKNTPSTPWPIFFPTPSNPELESIQSVLKESESVLERVKKHEENMVKEVTERAKELHEKEFKLPQQKAVICQVEKDSCVTCYKEYIKDPLKCSNFVRSYQECVRNARKQAQVPNS